MEKPFSDELLLDRIRQAIDLDREQREAEARRTAVAARYALLTPREREVMELVTAGKANKVIAADLGLSRRRSRCTAPPSWTRCTPIPSPTWCACAWRSPTTPPPANPPRRGYGKTRFPFGSSQFP